MNKVLLGGLTLGVGGVLCVAVAELRFTWLVAVATLALLAWILGRIHVGLALLLVYASLVGWLIRMVSVHQAGPFGVAIDALFVAMGLRLLWDVSHRRDVQRLRSALTPLVLIFVGFQCLEAFNPASPHWALGVTGLRHTLRALGFFLALYYLSDVRRIDTWCRWWLGTCAFVALYGMFQHYHGLLWQEMQWLYEEGNAQTHILGGYVRIFSTVGDAATFGFLMGMASLVWVAHALHDRGWRALMCVVAAVPFLYAMVLSYSRGPILAWCAGVVAMLVLTRRWFFLGLIASVLGLIGVGAGLAPGVHPLLDRVRTASRPLEDASFMVRVNYLSTHLADIVNRPFGHGLNTSGGGATKWVDPLSARRSVVGVPTDNYYFKIALELGWVGLLLWLVLQGRILQVAWVVYRRGPPSVLSGWVAGLFGVWVAVAVGAVSNDYPIQKPIAEFLWLSLGVLGHLHATHGVMVDRIAGGARPRNAKHENHVNRVR